jgi:hypothetical protein
MKNQLASILCEQPYQQPFGYHEISFNHEHNDIWHDNGIKVMVSEFLASYLEPIRSSVYVPRLVRSNPSRGGTVLT